MEACVGNAVEWYDVAICGALAVAAIAGALSVSLLAEMFPTPVRGTRLR